MNIQYAGCWVEFNGRSWQVCWPDTTVMQGGFATKRAADNYLNYMLNGSTS